MGRIDSKITIEKLIKSAGELFSEKGYDGVSVRDIAEKANVQLSAIGYHFKTKENLYISTMEYVCEKIVLTDEEQQSYLDKKNGLYFYILDGFLDFKKDEFKWFDPLINKGIVDLKTSELVKQYLDKLYFFVKKLIIKNLDENFNEKDIDFGVVFLLSFYYNYKDFGEEYNLLSQRELIEDFNCEVLTEKVYNMLMISINRPDKILLRR